MQKAALTDTFCRGLSEDAKRMAADHLRDLVGAASIATYVDRVRATIGALPQEITILAQKDSRPEVFETIEDASAFLEAPGFNFSTPTDHFIYQITYTDGTDFEQGLDSIDKVRQLHGQIERLAHHVAKFANS